MGIFKVTGNIIADVQSSGKSVNDVMRKVYEGEIADAVKKNSKMENVSPIKMAMMELGIDNTSMVKNMTTADAGEYLLPAYIDTRLRETIGASNMIGYLVEGEVPVNSTVVKSGKLDMFSDENKNASKLARVAEGADLPLATIKMGEAAISLHKLGRAVEYTYETMMYMTVPLFTKIIDAIANDAQHQNVLRATNVLVNGDGNKNAIESILKTATANKITEDEITKAIRMFGDKCQLPVTTIIAGGDMFDSLYNMKHSTNEALGGLRVGFNTPQYPQMSQIDLIRSDVPNDGAKARIVMLNKQYALSRYVAVGSMIEEYAKNIRNQTNLQTISEISAYGKFMDSACAAVTSA